MTAAQNLRHDTFAPLVGAAFAVAGTDLMLTLREAKVMGPAFAPDVRPEQFSVLFLGPAEPVLQQQIVRLEHEALAQIEIFLVPIGPSGGQMQYEAIFT